VHFAPVGHVVQPGATAAVRVTRAAPHWLRGELVEVVGSARPSLPVRTRIPVTAAPA